MYVGRDQERKRSIFGCHIIGFAKWCGTAMTHVRVINKLNKKNYVYVVG
jgi:hypothetical protein